MKVTAGARALRASGPSRNGSTSPGNPLERHASGGAGRRLSLAVRGVGGYAVVRDDGQAGVSGSEVRNLRNGLKRPGLDGNGADPMSLTEQETKPSAGHVTLDPDRKHDPHETRFGAFLKACIKMNASDLIMKSGQAPKIRLRGALKSLDTEPVSADEFVQIAKHILDEDGWADLHKLGSADFAYDYDDKCRFRVNLFQARGKLSCACRLIT